MRRVPGWREWASVAAAAAAASSHRSAGENSPGRKNLRARASALNARTSKYDCSHRGNWRRRCCAIEKGRARPSPPPPSLKCNACEMMPAHFSVLGVRACVRMQQHRRKSPCAWHANIMTKRRLRWRWRRRRRTAKCVHFRHYFYFFCFFVVFALSTTRALVYFLFVYSYIAITYNFLSASGFGALALHARVPNCLAPPTEMNQRIIGTFSTHCWGQSMCVCVCLHDCCAFI